MNNKIQKSILAGIVGTAVMTVVMMVSPMMGMPKMSPPELLSGMLGMPIMIGWIMHFMVGILFAFAFTYFLASKIKICNLYFKGVIFGIIVFVFAQIMMLVMGTMMPRPEMEGSMILTAMGSLMGHIIFGMAVALTVGNTCSSASCQSKE